MSEQLPIAGAPEQPSKPRDGKPAASQTRKIRRMLAARKQEAVLRVLKGEDLDLVSRDVGCTAADLSTWRDLFLECGASAFRSRVEDDRDRKLKAMAEKLEKKYPFALRGLKR